MGLHADEIGPEVLLKAIPTCNVAGTSGAFWRVVLWDEGAVTLVAVLTNLVVSHVALKFCLGGEELRPTGITGIEVALVGSTHWLGRQAEGACILLEDFDGPEMIGVSVALRELEHSPSKAWLQVDSGIQLDLVRFVEEHLHDFGSIGHLAVPAVLDPHTVFRVVS